MLKDFKISLYFKLLNVWCFKKPSFSFELLSYGKGNFIVHFGYFVDFFCLSNLYQ